MDDKIKNDYESSIEVIKERTNNFQFVFQYILVLCGMIGVVSILTYMTTGLLGPMIIGNMVITLGCVVLVLLKTQQLYRGLLIYLKEKEKE